MSAYRSESLPGRTEAGAGQDMDSKRKLQAAGMSFRGNQRAQAAAKQIVRGRQQTAAQCEKQRQDARKQALLEMMYAHSVLGIPLDGLAAGLGAGVDFTQPQQPGMAGDNMTTMPPNGQPLAGSFGM